MLLVVLCDVVLCWKITSTWLPVIVCQTAGDNKCIVEGDACSSEQSRDPLIAVILRAMLPMP